MDWWLIALVIVGALGGATISSLVAAEKGHESWMWFVLGLFFGIIAVLGTVGLPDRGPRKVVPSDYRQRGPGHPSPLRHM